LNRTLDGPQNRSVRCGAETNILPLPGIELRPSVAIPLEPSLVSSAVPVIVCSFIALASLPRHKLGLYSMLCSVSKIGIGSLALECFFFT
jgi:hypothetical protein